MRIATALILCIPLLAMAQSGAPKDPKTDRLWRAKCASCHGNDGKGETEQGKKMGVADETTAEWQKKFTDEKIKSAIATGINETRDGKKKEMEAYQTKLRPDQIDALVLFIRGLAK